MENISNQEIKDNKKIGAIIRSMRKDAGMSQMSLADKVGISYQQIQKYEKGKSKLTVPRLLQLARIFGVSFSAFIPQEDVGGASKLMSMSEDEKELLVFYRVIPKLELRLAIKSVVLEAAGFARSK